MAAFVLALALTKKGGGGQARAKAMKKILEYRGAAFCPDLTGRPCTTLFARFARWRVWKQASLANDDWFQRGEQQFCVTDEMYWSRMDVHYRMRSLHRSNTPEGEYLRRVGTMESFSPDVYQVKQIICVERNCTRREHDAPDYNKNREEYNKWSVVNDQRWRAFCKFRNDMLYTEESLNHPGLPRKYRGPSGKWTVQKKSVFSEFGSKLEQACARDNMDKELLNINKLMIMNQFFYESATKNCRSDRTWTWTV